MIQKIKQFLLITLASSSLLVGGIATIGVSTAFAGTDNITSQLCDGTNYATGNTTTGSTSCGDSGTSASGGDSLKTLAAKVVSILSIIVGIAAVVMIIVGGFRYITSGGDSGKVGNAKNSLIYAIVGLVIVALAQFIVHYVLNTANGVGGGANA